MAGLAGTLIAGDNGGTKRDGPMNKAPTLNRV